MKNILKTSVAVLVAATLFTGCIEETFPEGGTPTADQVQKNPAALKALVQAIPGAMVQAGNVNTSDQTDFGISAVHARTDMMVEDIAVLGDEPGYSHFNPYFMNRFQGSDYYYPQYYWLAYYGYIKSCNDVIRLIDVESAEGEAKVYLGRALAFRAKCYLDLARLYEPKDVNPADIDGSYDITNVKGLTVPIITEKTTEQEARFNPRAKRDSIYDFILNDLNEAAECLAGVKQTTFSDPDEAIINGLLARVYIELGCDGDTGALQKAYDCATKAIELSGCTPLTAEQWEDPINGFNNHASNNSWMWGLPVTVDQIGNLHNFLAHMCAEATWGYGDYNYANIGINRALYDQINNRDFRKRTFLDPEKDNFYKYKVNAPDREDFIQNSRPYTSLKFRPCQGETVEYTVGALADTPLMRVEEMMFIQMEAQAQMGNLQEAQRLLNEFMAYRITTGAAYDCTSTTSNKEEFLKEMMVQKRIEFWGEGLVMFDYKRLNHGFTRGYKGTSHATVARLNCSNGRSPQWNIVITRGEFQSNLAINDDNNNPDPTGLLKLWVEK